MNIDVPSGSSATIVDDPAGGTNRVAKLAVAPGGTQTFNHVALLQGPSDSLGHQNYDSWYAWNQYLDPTWQGAPNSTFNWTHEFLDSPSSAGACPGQLNYNFALGVNTTPSPDRWTFQVGYAGAQTLSNCKGTYLPTQFAGPSVTKGQWQHWVENIHWSAFNDGRIRIWIDGTLVFDHSGPNIYQHPDGSTGNETSYWMDYRSNTATGVDTIYYDNVAIGPTAASVGAGF